MSYAIIKVVYGVPKTEAVSEKIDEWEGDTDSDKWFEGDDGACGFTDLYSAGGPGFGYCGVELDELHSYGQDLVSGYKFTPTDEQKKEAERLVAALDPELKELAGPIGVYFIWSDA
jgi:hypothetical protein